MERKIAYVQNQAQEKNRRMCVPNVTNGYLYLDSGIRGNSSFRNKCRLPYKTLSASCHSFSVLINLIQFSWSRLCFMIYTSKSYCYSLLKSRYYHLLLHAGVWRVCLTDTIDCKRCHHIDLLYFTMYNLLPCILRTHIFGPNF